MILKHGAVASINVRGEFFSETFSFHLQKGINIRQVAITLNKIVIVEQDKNDQLSFLVVIESR